jgi:hypothetical protein
LQAAEKQLQIMHLPMSTFAVENKRSSCHMGCGSKTVPEYQGSDMRIVETGAAGLIAIAAQVLIMATVLI